MDFKGECKYAGCFMRNGDRKENEEKTQENSWLLMNAVLVVQNPAED